MSTEVNKPQSQKTNENSTNSISEERAPQFRVMDNVLRSIAYLANLARLEFPITVSVGGQIVSGYVIGFDEYMRLLREGFQPYVKSFAEGDQDFVEELLDKAVLTPPSTGDVPEIDYEDVRYLNLRDARVFGVTMGHPIPSNKGLVWRSPLEAINGFSIGTLSVENQED